MKKKIRRLAVLLAFATVFSLAACSSGGAGTSSGQSSAKTSSAKASSEGEKPVIRLGMMSSSDVIPFALINRNKLDERYGFTLDLQVFTSAKDRDAALQAGEIDGVLTDYVGVCMYRNAGLDVRITGITDGDYLLLAGKNTGIKNLSQIKGKSIAISQNTLIEYALDRILEKNQMQPADVKKEVVSRIPDRLELLRNNKIDLVLLPEPFATLALDDGAVELSSANTIGLYPAVSAFTEKVLEKEGRAIRNLYQAYNEAVDYMNSTDLSEYESTVIDAVGYPKEMNGKIKLKKFRRSKLPPKEDVENAIQWASAKGLCKSDLSYDSMIDDVTS
ncbi:ABC transporter substrate-binding protein [Caproicibacter sp.]|uniref:ABC transporter substrate-binding protein n=1 Tax=Caproicibacter sp. TaxID=2814884 RepID=UPI003988B77D